MKRDKFYIKTVMSLFTVLFLVSCEQKQLERDSNFEEKKDISVLNENNYINQAKYHYARYSQIKQQKNQSDEKVKTTTRAYPGAKLNRDNGGNYMSVIEGNMGENIDTLLLNQNGVEVKILLDKESKNVTIIFDGQKKSVNKKMTLLEFKNFNKGVENE